ncbi:protein FAR1-RELATED SEQUENCE 12 [Brassica rapa]|uniref:protein FAR1-RELATED SEQUENCE 12 n=1 Tax=Brassica campestris TaxID=3711 RepID=UPI00142D3FFB|nr:protein FAR1-RELATED SEQUENCE 12 [Brassica rapa]
MPDRPPRSIVADQDLPIKQALSQVFLGAHHRYSAWQIREKEGENLRPFPSEFKYEYEKCIYQTQTMVEFDSVWNTLINKYSLRDNVWLREVYEHRENWVPAYLRASFLAGINTNKRSHRAILWHFSWRSDASRRVHSRYEQGLEQRREEEKKKRISTLTTCSRFCRRKSLWIGVAGGSTR